MPSVLGQAPLPHGDHFQCRVHACQVASLLGEIAANRLTGPAAQVKNGGTGRQHTKEAVEPTHFDKRAAKEVFAGSGPSTGVALI
jgi:hypothetical protein